MKNLFLAILLISSATFSFGQQEQLPILKMESRILDFANLLTADQKKSIFLLMQDLETKVGSQIGIVTLESLPGQSINDYAKNQANLMGLGQKTHKGGILIVFALRNGLLRTEVSLGLDKIITNEISALINEVVMAPQLKDQKYAQAFYNGVKALKERIEADRNLIGK